jgi:sarcosine oxidase
MATGFETQVDVAVIGLGAMGASAVAHLATRGVRVIGLERFGPLHDRGSSHGDSRVIRLGYFEGAAYVPLLRRAYQNWRSLEARSHEELLTITGVLQIGRPDGPIVGGTIASCKANGLPFDILDREQMARRFPAFHLDAEDIAVLEPDGGFLRPERATLAYLRTASADGAILRFGERVSAIEPRENGVSVISDLGRYFARTVIIAAGSHIAGLVPELDGIAVPIKQVVGWYAPPDRIATALGQMPVFLREEGAEGSYFGFPALDAGGVKIGKHTHFMEAIDPEQPNPPVNEADRALLDAFIAKRIPAAAGPPLAYATCRYTMLPGDDFLIDHLPSSANVIVASPCSGHGFKFVSVIGEILADLATRGHTDLPITPFSFPALMQRAAAAGR